MSAVETSRRGKPVETDAAEVISGAGGRTETAGPSNPRRRRRYLYEPRPWRRSDVGRALVLVVIGLAVGVWGWFGVSGEVRLREQEGWIVVSAFGAAIAALGGVYLVTVAMRSVRLGQRQLMFDLADVMGWSVTVSKRGRLRLHSRLDPASETVAEETVSTLVVGPGMTIVHRIQCPIARNKAVEPISAADAAARNLGPCGVCGASAASGDDAA
jgi:hypothetical protein